MKSRISVLFLIVVLSLLAAAPSAAAPDAGPCVAGAAYDPACDVDHNGVVNILDIQLAAGHWNQSGSYPLDTYWSVTGNAGTTPGASYLGTTDNQALEVKVNGQRALRIEPNTTSPNLIGGYSGNSLTAGVVGGAIGGGGSIDGANRVTDRHGTIGGGEYNTAGNNTGTLNDAAWATVAGGYANTAGGLYATVAGGYQNDVTASYGTIAGGGPSSPGNFFTRNRVTDNYGTIGGGGNNQAGDAAGTLLDRSYATVSGGYHNTASGLWAAVGGGGDNSASGGLSAVGGGLTNTASGVAATIPGGQNNDATAFASFAAGQNANANHDGAFVWNDTHFASNASTMSNEFRVNASNGTVVTGETDFRAALLVENLGVGDGIYAETNGGAYAGVFLDNILVIGSCTGCELVYVARNTGEIGLEAGDIVASHGTDSPLTGTTDAVLRVRLADNQSAAVVGVVHGRAELRINERGSRSLQEAIPSDGAILPGDYLFVVVSGLTAVKVDPSAAPVQANQRLTVADSAGQARPLRSKLIDGMLVSEGTPVIGVALDAPKDGEVWVLVNPQ